jgi:hypothetical protein
VFKRFVIVGGGSEDARPNEGGRGSFLLKLQLDSSLSVSALTCLGDCWPEAFVLALEVLKSSSSSGFLEEAVKESVPNCDKCSLRLARPSLAT